jgi:threonine/homoserine/homoserine lactone efflux protein
MIEVQWLMFLLAAVAVISTPGQDMLLVMSRSITHGTRAGLATAGGVSLGLLGHTLLATAGLGALLRTSEWLFTVIKLVGAAYLLYLGIQLLLTRSAQISAEASQAQSLSRQFITGAASNITNPKIAVFYFAFLPQFVAPGATNPTLSILALGLAFAALTFLIKGPVAIFAGSLSVWFRAKPKALIWLYRSSGIIMIGLAVRLALSRKDV